MNVLVEDRRAVACDFLRRQISATVCLHSSWLYICVASKPGWAKTPSGTMGISRMFFFSDELLKLCHLATFVPEAWTMQSWKCTHSMIVVNFVPEGNLGDSCYVSQ